MLYEKYVKSIIEDYTSDCISGGFIEGEFTEKEIENIKERFEEHRHCYKCKEEFDIENLNIMESVVYGDYSNVAIECNQCNTVIVDIEASKGDEE